MKGILDPNLCFQMNILCAAAASFDLMEETEALPEAEALALGIYLAKGVKGKGRGRKKKKEKRFGFKEIFLIRRVLKP
jgi:hypothetical protein